MELRLLRYALAIADCGTIAAAAERLHVTQPTLGRQLRDFERRLGADLFTRENRRMTPTIAGAVLLGHARAILAATEAAEREVRQVAAGIRGRLTVAFAGSGINGPLAATLATFRRRFPDVELRLVESFNDAEMSAGVLDGSYDLAVQRLPAADERLRTRLWWQEPLALYLPADHELARGDGPLPLTALGEIPLLLWPREASPHSYDEIVELCHRAGVTPRIAAEGRTVQTLLALVAVGLGAAVLADSFRALNRQGVTPRPLDGASTTNLLVWRADAGNPLAGRFRDLIDAGPAVRR
ncbi:LysR family transcriptional regulator [Actinoplanes ianthinogenes]|uniref:LysR family transcriptional regulator n=1 Tax=Actinoplanes ianthinogenes TaxID=122358 RepID=A0ABM7M8L6_9ACTN|nr:LysR family transcriptional regulator [Actinoplanes ianthinogenes]BCJ47969.1 LysR family transcriptional regulator [Actinoplanes ianthinogenes]GGR05441.1 LysR family transcriptional regulator [Actinoplanes ianthinogenes]